MAEAKQLVAERIKASFGKDFLGEDNGRVYIRTGDKVVAISMTCPKIIPTFEDEVPPWEETEITQKEQNDLLSMMERLGL